MLSSRCVHALRARIARKKCEGRIGGRVPSPPCGGGLGRGVPLVQEPDEPEKTGAERSVQQPIRRPVPGRSNENRIEALGLGKF